MANTTATKSITMHIPVKLHTWLKKQGNMTATVIKALESLKEQQ